MKTLARGGALLAALALSGACGGSSKPSAAPTTEPSGAGPSAPASPSASAAAASAAVTSMQLKAALLTVQDFPTGWRTKAVEPDNKDKAGGDCGPRFDAFDKKYPDAPAKAEADFEESSSEIDEELQAYDNASGLSQQVAEYAQIVRSCTSLVIKPDGKTVTLAVSELSFPKMADEAFGFTAAGTYQGVKIEINAVLIRRGSILVQFRQSDVVSTDTDLLVTTAQKALAKLIATVPAA